MWLIQFINSLDYLSESSALFVEVVTELHVQRAEKIMKNEILSRDVFCGISAEKNQLTVPDHARVLVI
jgi:hypothetical protein